MCVCVCVYVCMCVCVCVCVFVVVGGGTVFFFIIHLYCSEQFSMFNMEERCRNKIIIIIITRCKDPDLHVVDW